jgi:hypothetical protein
MLFADIVHISIQWSVVSRQWSVVSGQLIWVDSIQTTQNLYLDAEFHNWMLDYPSGCYIPLLGARILQYFVALL